ncbi:hypothetical protein, partial [Leptospira borgpetersenii]|uniref:hypothetical protein n=1 Tax=Leptospira borgpetersenii TaxID=174 RepID=UPI0027DCE76F
KSHDPWELLRFRFITNFWGRFLFSGFGTSSKYLGSLLIFQKSRYAYYHKFISKAKKNYFKRGSNTLGAMTLKFVSQYQKKSVTLIQ